MKTVMIANIIIRSVCVQLKWTVMKMKVVEDENQIDKYGRNYIKFTGVKNLQEIQNWLFEHYQGYKFAMEFDCYYDECQEIGNEYWVYFLDDLAEEVLIYSGYNKAIENGKVIYRR